MPTVAEALEALKNVSALQDHIAALDDQLIASTKDADALTRQVMSDPNLTDADREQLIDGVSAFVANTYQKAIARAMRAQRLGGNNQALVEPQAEDGTPESTTTFGGFPRLS